jgi:hypothetical protein
MKKNLPATEGFPEADPAAAGSHSQAASAGAKSRGADPLKPDPPGRIEKGYFLRS